MKRFIVFSLIQYHIGENEKKVHWNEEVKIIEYNPNEGDISQYHPSSTSIIDGKYTKTLKGKIYLEEDLYREMFYSHREFKEIKQNTLNGYHDDYDNGIHDLCSKNTEHNARINTIGQEIKENLRRNSRKR